MARITGHRHSAGTGARPPPNDAETWGALAGADETHVFRELTWGLGGSQCLLCFGYVDDIRHLMPEWWTEIEEATIATYEDLKWQKHSDSETSTSSADPAMATPSN
jgi:hypothetical protein